MTTNKIISGKSIWAGHIPDNSKAWQPIETAPKDGSWAILWFPKAIDGQGLGLPAHYNAEPLEWGADAFWEGPYSDGYMSRVFDDFGLPTHWMPLPEPPL